MVRPALFLITAALLTTGPAYAQSLNSESRLYTAVSYKGLDLNGSADAHKFIRRLEIAIKAVCVVSQEYKACRRAAMIDAVNQTGSSMVATLAGVPAPATQFATR